MPIFNGGVHEGVLYIIFITLGFSNDKSIRLHESRVLFPVPLG